MALFSHNCVKKSSQNSAMLHLTNEARAEGVALTMPSKEEGNEVRFFALF